MFRARWLLLPGIVVGFFMFMIYNGLVEWHKDDYKCFHGKGWYNALERQRILSIKRVHFYYQPKTYGCVPHERYDPEKYQMENGVLKAIPDSYLTE